MSRVFMSEVNDPGSWNVKEVPTKEHKVLWNGPLLDGTLTVFLSEDTRPGVNGGQRILYVMKSHTILDHGHGYIALYNPASLQEFMELVKQQYMELVYAERQMEQDDGYSICH